jgi:hypothetical protein
VTPERGDSTATERSLRLWFGVLVLVAGVALIGVEVDAVHRSYDARVVPDATVEADDDVTPQSRVDARTWRALRSDGYRTTEYQVGVGPTHVPTVGVDRDGARRRRRRCSTAPATSGARSGTTAS